MRVFVRALRLKKEDNHHITSVEKIEGHQKLCTYRLFLNTKSILEFNCFQCEKYSMQDSKENCAICE